MTRNSLFEALLAHQQAVVDQLKNTVDNYDNAADVKSNQTVDLDDQSHQDQAGDMQNVFVAQYEKALANLGNVKRYSADNTSHSAEEGSFVETANKIFFLGGSTTPFDYKDKEVIGVMEAAPAFSVIKGVKKGDTFQLGDNSFEVLHVH